MRQALDDLLSEIAQSAAVINVLHYDLELVTAQTTDFLTIAYNFDESFRHLLEQRISCRVTESIVDMLKPVEVDQHNRTGAPLLLEGRQCGFEQLTHTESVQQAGQRIICGET